MLLTFDYTRTVTVEMFESMSAAEFISLRDTNEGLYDKMMDEAMDKAYMQIAEGQDHDCTTFVDAED